MTDSSYQKLSTCTDSSLPVKDKPGLFSLLTYGWMNDVFRTGNLRPLEQFDFLPLDEKDKTQILTEQLGDFWNIDILEQEPKLWKSVTRLISRKEICLQLLLGVLRMICEIMQPLVLGWIIFDLNSSNGIQTITYFCPVFLALARLCQGFCGYYKGYRSALCGARQCAALRGIIYRKVHLLSLQTLQRFTEGRAIDLVAYDIKTLQLATFWIFESLQCFMAVPLVLFVLGYFIDWVTLSGVLFLCSLLPIFALCSSIGGELRRRTALVSDQRISVVNELVSGIRAVKTQARENDYRQIVKDLRRLEVSKMRQKSIALSIIDGFIFTASSTATFVAVSSLILSGTAVTPVTAFVLLAFMEKLRWVVSMVPGRGLRFLYEAFVSLKRIEEFLLLENLPQLDSTMPKAQGDTARAQNVSDQKITSTEDQPNTLTNHDGSLSVSDLSCNLSQNGKTTLDGITFNVPKESLAVITGSVGSGKSTLLSSIGGQVKLLSGTVKCSESLVYVCQVPWIFSGTVRENILFGKHFEVQWYAQVIQACSLVEDLDRFPDRDQTVVGERGVVLSGGQKARVSLARAVYANAKVYLLDNPLSAVDLKVGEQIFEKCICQLLANKTRLLVSYYKIHLERADQIIVLENGAIVARGSFASLEKSGKLLGIICDETKSTQPDRESTGDESYVFAHSMLERKLTRGEHRGLEILDEDRAVGSVPFSLYMNYFRAEINSVAIVALIILCFIIVVITVSPNVWLAILTKTNLEEQQNPINLAIYTSLSVAAIFMAAVFAAVLLFTCLRASELVHDNMVISILRAPVSFFDTNPAGRIMNRFSRDIGIMDELLPVDATSCVQFLTLTLGTVLVPAIVNLWLLPVVAVLVVVLFFLVRYYLTTSRQLKRLEASFDSPVLSHFSETLDGLVTIRTRKMGKEVIDKFYRLEDVHNELHVMNITGARWVGLRVELLGALFIATVGLFVLVFTVDSALAGLSLAYVISMAGFMQFAVRWFSDLENEMISVERVMTYCGLEAEPGYQLSKAPSADWPSAGDVTFTNVSLVYYPGGLRVINNLNFHIKGKSRIGVAGRTGAGKSSMVAALLRMPEADGDITIDGVKIKDINVQESRRCISVLSQTPVLFSGPLKRALDPLGKHKDADLWAALEEVQLRSFVENLDGQLNYKLLEKGGNLSVGEQQLICLARTLLQRNKIIILDEPTAHVDPVTEQTIWNTVHHKLKDSTVITIAHRLNTIRDCDVILVLRDGRVVEFDSFDTLLGREGGELASIAQHAV